MQTQTAFKPAMFRAGVHQPRQAAQPTFRGGSSWKNVSENLGQQLKDPMGALLNVQRTFGLKDDELAALFNLSAMALQEWKTNGIPLNRQAMLKTANDAANALRENLKPAQLQTLAKNGLQALSQNASPAAVLRMISNGEIDKLVKLGTFVARPHPLTLLPIVLPVVVKFLHDKLQARQEARAAAENPASPENKQDPKAD